MESGSACLLPEYDGAMWNLLEGDCRKYLPKFKDGEFDAVVTDPPYGVNESYNSFEDSRANVRALIAEVLPQLRRVAKVVLITPGVANIWLYPEPDWTLCWVEKAGVGRCSWGYSCWQPVLAYGKCPALSLGRGGRPDIYIGRGETSSAGDHPCAKPLGVMRWIVDLATQKPGCRILDPFSGSGTTGVACIQAGHEFTGIELDSRYCSLVRKRLADTSPGLFSESKKIKRERLF